MANRNAPGQLRELRNYDDVDTAVARIKEIYGDGCKLLEDRFVRFCNGETSGPIIDACYPYLRINVTTLREGRSNRLAFGSVAAPGTYGTTIT